MFVLKKKKDESRWQVQIVESVRDGAKVRQKIVRNIGVAYSQKELEQFNLIAEDILIRLKNARKPVLAFCDPAEFHRPKKRKKTADDNVFVRNLREEKRINEGFADIFGSVYDQLNFDHLIKNTSKDRDWNDILASMVLARIANPKSKLATHHSLKRDFDIKIPVQKIYRMLDHLADQENSIKKAISQSTFSLFKQNVDILFFDVTTLYFESIECDDLRKFGFSKDCKFKESQVVLALVATTDGLPITYKLFPGNTYEGHTLITMVDELRNEYQIKNILLVADRAMFTNDNLNAMDDWGIHYIVAAKLKTLTKEKKQEILESEFKAAAVANEFQWVKSFDHNGRRLIVSYSSKRARKDLADRARLVERLLGRTKDDEKINIKDLIPNHGTKKYLKIIGGTATMNYEKIDADAEWDGLHGIITNNHNDAATTILERYRGLWQIEEAFRVNKHSLKMRPIYHWSPRRIKAHVLLCYISYALTKHVLHRLKVQNHPTTLEQLREQLFQVQASVVVDKATTNRYVIPSATDAIQRQIYRLLKIPRDETPYPI